MEPLDFGKLSNDQLLSLLRAVLQECVERGQNVCAAAQAVGLDENEKARVIQEASTREAAKLRAQERERIAREAAELVRRKAAAVQHAADELRKGKEEADRRAAAADAAEQAKREAEKAIAEKVAAARRRLGWLARFASHVQRPSSDITLLLFDHRVIVNDGADRYSRSHLVDVDTRDKSISTARDLVKSKPALLTLALEFALDRAAAGFDGKTICYVGKDVLETLSTYAPQEAQCSTH